MRFTLNMRPTIYMEHPTQPKLVETCPNAGVETTNSHPNTYYQSTQHMSLTQQDSTI